MLQDTGVANDGYTTTPVIVATVNNTTANASLKLEVDANNDGIADYSRELGTFSAGTYQFEFDSSSFVLTDKFGQQNISYRIVAQTAASGSISSQWQAYTYNWVDEQTQLTFHATEGSVSLINTAAQTEILQINDLRQGVAVPADAVGVGYFMYSAANLANRFSANPPAANTAANIAVVRYNGESNTWEYTDGQAWHTFQVHATDRLLAIVDLSARITRNLTGEVGEIFGIKQGFTDSDISIVSNQFGGSVSEGNYQVFGSYVRTKPSLAESQPSFEFGQVSQGSQLTRTLTIKNVFDHAIDVMDVGLPLGFAAPGFAPGVLLPGQSMNIILRLDGIFPGDASGAIGINTVANEVESV